MRLSCLGTGSSGNCYVLDDGESIILLDAGIPIKDIKIGINFEVSRIACALITHEHKDHSCAVKDLEKMGKYVIKPYDEKFTKLHSIEGRFTIQYFELTDTDGNPSHSNGDGTPCRCFGYLIYHPDLGRLLYITDTQFIKWRFRNIDHLLLGIDYSADKLREDENIARANHTWSGHLELQTAKEFVKVTEENSNLKNIIICHCSASNADAEHFMREIIEVSGNANVVMAKKGLVI